MCSETLTSILQIINKSRWPLEDEKVTQRCIAECFVGNGFDFKREHYFNKENRIDFFFPESKIGIEIKIGKPNRRKIYEQIKRYSQFAEIEIIILLTNRAIGMDEKINEKTIIVKNLSKAWL